MTRPIHAAGYARAIERMWSSWTERAVVLSPREWAAVNDWYERGIPLAVIEEAIDAAGKRRRRGGAPRSLLYLGPAVEEAWEAIVDGRVDPPATADPSNGEPGRGPAIEPVGAEAGTPLRALLDEFERRSAAGAGPQELESWLDERLVEASPPELRQSVEDKVERQLARYGDVMTSEVLASTRRSAIVDLLRKALGLYRSAASNGSRG